MTENDSSSVPKEPDKQPNTDANAEAELGLLRELVVRNEKRWAFLSRVGRELGNIRDIEETMRRTVELARDTVHASSGSLILLDEDGKVSGVILSVQDRQAEATAEAIRQVMERGLASWTATHRRSTVVRDTHNDPRWLEMKESVQNVRSALCVPLLYREHLRGILTLTDPRPDYFAPSHLDMLRAAAPQMALALENARLYRRVSRSRAHLETILTNLSDALFTLDAAGIVTLANPALEQMVGRPAEEMMGRPFRQAIPIQDDPSHEAIDQVLQGGIPFYEADLWLRDKAGQEIPIRLGCGPLAGEEEHTAGAVVVLRDISYLKEIERLREELTEMQVHDLRAPLASVASTIQLLQQYPIKSMEEEIVRDLLSISERNVSRLCRMIDALLDVQRIEEGQLPLDIAPRQVQEAVTEVMQEVAPLAAESEIETQIELPEDLPPIAADGDMLRRILWNLLDNALKYVPRGGQIRLTGEALTMPGEEELPTPVQDLPPGTWVVLNISDTGLGIPPEDRERIFDKFAQAHLGQGRRRGIGLGLTFCRLAVEAHGGKIWVGDQTGDGSTFSFTLPAAPPPPTSEEPA